MNRGKVKMCGYVMIRCFDYFGKKKWEEEFPNGVVNEGLDDLLDAYFNQKVQNTNYFMGLLDSPAVLSATDTMGAHAGWTEFGDAGPSDGYDEITRPEWNPAAAASQQVSNVVAIVFTINATGTIAGIFISTNATKGGIIGVLWATALFAQGDKNVAAADVLEVTYTVTAADA